MGKMLMRLFIAVLFSSMTLLGCSGGGGGTTNPSPATYNISGKVSASGGSGLAGVTVSLTGSSTATATTDSSGNYSFSGLSNGTYVVSASKASYSCTPLNKTVTIAGSNQASVNFTGTAVTGSTYSITGAITLSGSGLSGVTVALSGDNSGTATTDSNGVFTFEYLADGSYVITPSKSGYTFTPASKSVTLSGSDSTGNNFTATAVPMTYTIAGTVTGDIQQSVVVNLSGASTSSTTTDGSGNYLFTGLSNGNYIVTPVYAGYAFSPSSKAVTISGANSTSNNFVSTQQTYSISGTVSGNNYAGVTITVTGSSTHKTTTNGSGAYTVTGLTNGNYTVTPSAIGNVFAPVSRAVTINGANATGQDFVSLAVQNTFTISGTVTVAMGGPLQGVTVTLGGTASGTASTDSSGYYSFTVANGSYTLTPALNGYQFTPSSSNVTVNGLDSTGNNFSASSVIFSYSVSGTISYSGTHTGNIYIGVAYNQGGATGLGTMITAPGPFTIRGLTPGQYYLYAYMDLAGNVTPNTADPQGQSAGSFMIISSNVASQNIVLADSAATPPVPRNPNAIPMPSGAIISWDSGGGSCLGVISTSCDTATSYKIYSSTDNVTYNPIAQIPETDNGVYFVTGLTDGQTYYYKISALMGSTESAQSAALGPITIGASGGGYTVSGTVTFGGASASGHNMIVAVVGTNTIFGNIYHSPTSPQSFTIAGVQPGTYQVFAFIDMDDNGYFSPGDKIPNFDFMPIITVTNSDVTKDLTLPAGSGEARVLTNHQFNSAWTPNDQYQLNTNIYNLGKRVISATIMSGPNIPLPFDMLNPGGGSPFQSWIWLGGTVPTTSDQYVYHVTYSDFTSETLTAGVTGVLTSSQMATPTSPANNATGVALQPTFTWSAPSSPPTSYSYDVGIGAHNRGWIWDYLDSNYGNIGLPSSQTSVVFNANGGASQSSLTSLTQYDWWLTVIDGNGNKAQSWSTFTTQ